MFVKQYHIFIFNLFNSLHFNLFKNMLLLKAIDLMNRER